MFAALRNIFRPRAPHPHQRECMALLSCVVAWRRAVIEAKRREANIVDDDALSALRWYWHGAGGTDPFTSHVLALHVGALDDDLFLLALYRIETAVALAWALRLVDEIPPPTERADVDVISRIFPLDAETRIKDASLRSHDELHDAANAWRTMLQSCAPGSLEFSRAYERARGLLWLNSVGADLHDIDPT
jgi:hypothetical protein